jgi:hypothetical protein
VSAYRAFETVDPQARAFLCHLLALTPAEARHASAMSTTFSLPAQRIFKSLSKLATPSSCIL